MLLAVCVIGAVAIGLIRGDVALNWHATLRQLRRTDLAFFLLALGIFHAGFLLRCVRWRVLLANLGIGRGHRGQMPAFARLVDIMYRAWFVNTVTVAQVGDVYRSYLLQRRTGSPLALMIGTVVVERLMDLIVLATLLLPAIGLAFGRHVPAGVRWMLPVAVTLVLAGSLALVALPRLGPRAGRYLPTRLALSLSRLSEAVAASLRRIPLVLALTIGGWVGESVTLALVGRAVGVSLSVPQTAAVALVTALLTILPVTPGGLGVADVGMLFLLERFGVVASAATALTLLARAITIGSVVASGGLLCLVGSWYDRRATPATTNGVTSWT